MKLRELYDRLKAIEKYHGLEDEIWDNELVVPLDQPSSGGRITIPIKSLSIGFDWEHGRAILNPEHKLVKSSKNE